MKLTNHIRDAFVRAAMDDVPISIDHTETIRKLVSEDAASRLPASVRRVWNDAATRDYIQTGYANMGKVGIAVPSVDRYEAKYSPSEKTKHAVDRLLVEQSVSEAERKKLRDNLKAVAYSVTTRKALADALPEFEKYLPADDAAALRTVPAIANVMADFVKAGWPKDKKAAKQPTKKVAA